MHSKAEQKLYIYTQAPNAFVMNLPGSEDPLWQLQTQIDRRSKIFDLLSIVHMMRLAGTRDGQDFQTGRFERPQPRWLQVHANGQQLPRQSGG